MSRYVIDGRFLAARPTGLHRVARALTVAGLDAGIDAEVWAPAGTGDALVGRSVRLPPGRVSGRLWEQVVLPVLAGRRTVVSLTNTAPLARPGVVMVHDLAARVGPQWFAGSMRSYAATVLAGARRAQLVLTVSEAVRGELVDAGVVADRVVVIPPAVDPGFRPADAATVTDVRRRYGVPASFAVVVGAEDPRKDAATAVAAHRRVVTGLPHGLVLLGTRHPTFAPVRLPEAAGVLRLGHVPEPDLVALLSAADVLLYPSRYEGFGLPPLEALACGTPAVVSDIPALRESTAGRARLVPAGDVEAWAAALSDGLSGRLAVSPAPRRTWEAAGRQLADALSGAPGSSPGRR